MHATMNPRSRAIACLTVFVSFPRDVETFSSVWPSGFVVVIVSRLASPIASYEAAGNVMLTLGCVRVIPTQKWHTDVVNDDFLILGATFLPSGA